MSDNLNNYKTEFVRFVMSSINYNSSDEQKSREYLSSRGLDVESILSSGLKKIKKIQMQINADKTRMEMISNKDIKKKAEEWVISLYSKIDFDFTEFARKEDLAVSFRNIESLSKDDQKEILVKHFTLKFIEVKNSLK